MYDYIKDPKKIYDISFKIIQKEVDFSKIPNDLKTVLIRIIHSCGMTDIIQDFCFSENSGFVGKQALKNGANILCDSRMVANGIIKKRLPANNLILCTLNDQKVEKISRKINNTRSAAAVELWIPFLSESIVVIGNAPTALFHLLEMINYGISKPSLIIGFPVGFVGASESKQELIRNHQNIPFITIKGRRGGSPMAASVINALASDQG